MLLIIETETVTHKNEFQHNLSCFIFTGNDSTGNILTTESDIFDNGSSFTTEISSIYDEDTTNTNSLTNEKQDFLCYENFTIYYPIFLEVQFWIEGVLLIG